MNKVAIKETIPTLPFCVCNLLEWNAGKCEYCKEQAAN